MIVYLDSSSIISLYLNEEGRHETVRGALAQADAVCSSAIAYAEVRAGLARATRDQRLGPTAYRQVLIDVQRDWAAYVRVAVSDALIDRAGDLAEARELRGYDAVHLASALTIRDRTLDAVMFAAWDEGLCKAATAEGLILAPAVSQ